ncbi:diguanylate cyclase domain-containing protein [Neptunicella marina]|uniref:diguanylate cyclase n=1 Tax=Neptunicella marina TaxID=2125989 RepID=A0A8J6M3F5_9ALTE|nr:diguanylate cyclase [Neptunicella marina]
MRHKIAGAPITTGLQSINCTVSIGVTTQDCLTSFEKLYEQADSALYQSKHNGRNKVTFEQSSNKQT